MQYVNVDWSFLYDRSPTLDDLKDLNGFVCNDGRSLTKTYFLPGEVEYESKERKNQYYRLAKINDGVREDGHKGRTSKADGRRFAKTFCSQVELTKHQTERVLYVLEKFDMSRKGNCSFEEIILGIISLVVEPDYRDVRNEDSFQSLMIELDVTPKRLKSVRKMVRKQDVIRVHR